MPTADSSPWHRQPGSIGTNLFHLLIVGYLTAALVHPIHVSNRTLLKMASRDALVGLFNRSACDDLARSIHGKPSVGGPCRVITKDMDGLKRANDTKGHGVGDRAILGLAQRLMKCKRSSDVLLATAAAS